MHMSETKVKIIEAALTAFSRYGLRRVSMGDVAVAASISRQTLYAHYKNKDELFLATMQAAFQQILTDLKFAWKNCETLTDVIDAYYDIAVYKPYEIMREHPDLRDILTGATSETASMAKQVEAEKAALVADQIAPYAEQLAKIGSSPLALGEYLVRTSSQLKYSVDDMDELKRFLATLRSAILMMAGEPVQS
jgi:AcrR family transcriptional regulator